ncbi:MAG TPA: type I phosphomannose isomerase catalytic subunit [Caulobacteraceae bacterium]|nr:type I phosphomannose isomerase catalytic subunit [Caulobacteraceae bacterium]
MSAQALYPLRFEPLFQYRLWGGRKLGAWMDEPLPPHDPIGEAWILSDRPDHASPIANGPLKGRTLTDLMREHKDALLGPRAQQIDRFPLLLKFLDVKQMLSVQVHPRDDQTALIPAGDTGKTEAWVVLEAEPKSRIYAGLRPGVTPQDLRGLTLKTADDRLASFKPEVGQGVQIEAGTVHSLGDGVMVFEVQENSDVTFRLYDWDHVDARTGKPRDLQVDQALACVDFGQGAVTPVTPKTEATDPVRREAIFDNAHFRLERLTGAAPFSVGASGAPRILVCVDGAGVVEAEGAQAVNFRRGGVILLPAALGPCRLRPDRPTTVLQIAIPDLP